MGRIPPWTWKHNRECVPTWIFSPGFILIALIFFMSPGVTEVNANEPNNASGGQCASEKCHKIKEGMLNVHLVAHTHDDVGWLKTLEQYYDGSGEQNSIANGNVRQILNTMTEELAKSPDRKFIYVEMAFFWLWWREIDEKKRELTRQLVKCGQLEFTSGGFVMNDEATAHYVDIIQQFTLGLRFLNETFGPDAAPRVAWQIDTFGHSKEQASLSAALDFDGMFLGRIDFQDKDERIENRNMEMIWEGDQLNLGEDSWIFTSVLFNLYQPPRGFCFDSPPCSTSDLPSGNSLSPDEKSELQRRIDDFIKSAEDWAQPYKTKNILMTMGSDFTYVDSNRWFDNLDILIKNVNERQKDGLKVNLLYSTPSCYLQEVNRANLTWPIKSDDFFPYQDSQDAVWTGFYSSRPTFKHFVRRASSFLQGCQQLSVMAADTKNLEEDHFSSDVLVLEENLSVAQHHDAITGTSRQHVINDYSLKLHRGMQSCEKVVSTALRKLEADSQQGKVENPEQFDFCPLLNISSCPFTESEPSFIVTVYNPLTRDDENSLIRLPVPSTKGRWKVENENGEILSQLFPIPHPVIEIPGRESNATQELVFSSGLLPGLSVTKFKVMFLNSEQEILRGSEKAVESDGSLNQDFYFHNSIGMTLTFDGASGLLKKVKSGQEEINLSQNFFFYEGGRRGRRSGAYLFEPSTPEPFMISDHTTYKVFRGRDVMEVHQTFGDWMSQVIRVFANSSTIEFEWLAGSIPLTLPNDTNPNHELITRFSSDLETHGVFYTDANGRQLVERKRNTRETFTDKVKESVAGNYYPVTTRMLITEGKSLSENKKTLILINDRSQGGSSLHDGQMEVMLHRRILSDDDKGMGEGLDEKNFGDHGLIARGKFWLIFSGEGTGVHNSIHRQLSQSMYMDKIISFRRTLADYPEPFAVPSKFSELAKILPPNCHLLSLQRLSTHQFLIRFEHFYEQHESPKFSVPAQIPLAKLMEVLNFHWIRETTLGANQWKDQVTRMNWKSSAGEQSSKHDSSSTSSLYYDGKDPSHNSSSYISLNPFQIRTFIFEL